MKSYLKGTDRVHNVDRGTILVTGLMVIATVSAVAIIVLAPYLFSQ